MKKILVCLLATILTIALIIPSFAETNTDFESYLEVATAADLLALRDQVDAAIQQSDTWEEVTVPVGTYQVGVDIPAGNWAVSAGMTSARCSMMVGNVLEDNGREVDYWDSDSWHDFELLSEYSYDDLDYLQSTVENVYLPDGYYVEISDGSVLFTPYHGSPNFQFFAADMPSETSSAEFSIDGLSYDELVSIKNQLNLAIWNSYEWERVLVPFGIYEIGVDFPEGHWSFEAPDGSYVTIEYGTELSESQMNLSLSGEWTEYLYSESYRYRDDGDVAKTDLNMSAGNYLSVGGGVYTWVTPYVSGGSLGFKGLGGETSSNVATSTSEEEMPLTYNGIEYEQLDYEENARNPESYSGKKVVFEGTVIQVVEGGLNTIYRVSVNSSDVVFVRYTPTSGDGRILEDDRVIVYGTSQGVETYESTLGGNITIPACFADAIILDD